MLDNNFTIKNHLQNWLEKPDYKFMVTIPCDRNNEMTQQEMEQRLRIFDYKLNKKYMICKFPQLPLQNRIWSIGFIEKTTDEDTHLHILLFIPEYLPDGHSGFSKNMSPFKSRFIVNDIIQSWISIPSKKPDGKLRKIKPPHIMRIKEKIKQSVARYVSKQIKLDWDSMFFAFDGFDTHDTDGLFSN